MPPKVDHDGPDPRAPNGWLVPDAAQAAVTPASQPLREQDLSPDQLTVYRSVQQWLGSSQQVLKMAGFAGTGKSSITALLAQHFEEQRREVGYCAYTGKAAGLLRQRIEAAGVDPYACCTIHRLIYRPVQRNDGSVAEWRRVPVDELPVDLLVVDEASMVGREIWQDLLQYGVKILLVGDHGQLPPVGTEQVNLMERPDLRLEQIHRQAADNPILQLSAEIRTCRNPTETVLRFPDDPAGRIRHLQEDDAYHWMQQQFSTPASSVGSVVVCGRNQLRTALNDFVREQRPPLLTPGDTVICLRNQYRLPGGILTNGMRGIVTQVHDVTQYHIVADVNFPDDAQRLVRGRMLRQQFGRQQTFRSFDEIRAEARADFRSWHEVGLMFDYAAAVTCHRLQGSQLTDVAVVQNDVLRGPQDPDGRRWLYTAVSRASERLVIIV